jgi:hypothetical protein
MSNPPVSEKIEGDVDEKSDFTYLRIHDKVSSCHARRD